jgi:hypothetical protein
MKKWLDALIVAIFIAYCMVWASVAFAKEKVDVALVLAIDHSSSVDATEWKLQLEGYAEALRSEAVKASMFSGYHQKIAVTVFRWSDYSLQETLIGWTVIRTPEDADMLAAQIMQHAKLPAMAGTCVAGALTFAKEVLSQAPIFAERQVVDVSGDEAESCGPNGPYARSVRDELVALGVQINGLPILDTSPPSVTYGIPAVSDQNANTERFYSENVVGGPGAFMVTANGFHEFGMAVQRKLLLEIAGL